jgi:hypothetical protein
MYAQAMIVILKRDHHENIAKVEGKTSLTSRVEVEALFRTYA